MFTRLTAIIPRHNTAAQSWMRSTCRAMHYKLPWEKEQPRGVPETAVIPDHIGWVTINEGTWKAEMARQVPCVPLTVGSWWAMDMDEQEEDVEQEEDPSRMDLMNRNSRFGKKANGGKRACSRQRRRSKRRAFGNHRR